MYVYNADELDPSNVARPHSMITAPDEGNGTQDEQLYSIIRASAIEESEVIYQVKDSTCDNLFYETSCNEGNVPIYEAVKSTKSPVDGLLLITNPTYGISDVHGRHVQTGILNATCNGIYTVSGPVYHSVGPGNGTTNTHNIPPMLDPVFEETGTSADMCAAMSTDIPDTCEHEALKMNEERSQAALESMYDVIKSANISRSGTYEGKPVRRNQAVLNPANTSKRDTCEYETVNPVYGTKPVNNGEANYKRVQPIGQIKTATCRAVLNPVYDGIPTRVKASETDIHEYETVQPVNKTTAATCRVVLNPVYGTNPVNTSEAGYETVPNSVDTSEGVALVREYGTVQHVGQINTATRQNQVKTGESDTHECETVKMGTQSALFKKETINTPPGPAAAVADVPHTLLLAAKGQ